MATCEVIECCQLGANLIITMNRPLQSSGYNGLVNQHPSYIAKRQLIERSSVVIWRFHDYLHSLPPDSTVMGLLQALGWEDQMVPETPYLCTIPPRTLLELAKWVKQRLGLSAVRVVGNLEATCRKICLLPGFPPAEMQIGA
jgi:hypothetical protein